MHHIFLFSGPETFRSSEKIRFWKKSFDEKYGSTTLNSIDCEARDQQTNILSTIKTTLQTPSIFQHHALTIIRSLSSLKDVSFSETIAPILKTLPKTHVVVLWEDEIDRRTTFYTSLQKAEKEGVLEGEYFDRLSSAQLRSWITKRVQEKGGFITPPALLELLAFIDPQTPFTKKEINLTPSLWEVEQELSKLCAYAQSKPIDVHMVNLLVSQKGSSHIFELIDSLLDRSPKKILLLSKNLLSVPKSQQRKTCISLCAFLISQFRSFCILKSMLTDEQSEKTCAQHLSWNPKRVWVISQKVKKYSLSSYEELYKKLLALDTLLKYSTGDPRGVFEHTLLKLTHVKK